MSGMIRHILRQLTLTGWTMVVACVAVLILLGTCSYQARRDDRAARQAEAADRAMADGRTASAREASVIRDANDDANQSTRNQVEEATDALRRETDPAVRDADARRRLCALDPTACPN